MGLLYRAERIGKNGKVFTMYKIRTLRESDRSSYNHSDNYVLFGKFMRKYRIDEIPQLFNLLKGDMNLVGPRPQDAKTIDLYPLHLKEILLSIKPGLFGLSGIHFMDEEHLLTLSDEPAKDYWGKIFPIKTALDFFYIENRCLSLNLWIIWQSIKKGLILRK